MDTLFPTIIITYLELCAPLFSANHFTYFQGFVLAQVLLGQSQKCVTNMVRVCFFIDRHVSSWERFLSESQWDLNGVRQRLVNLLQEQLGNKLLICGAYLAWVDTTLVAKVKGKMPGEKKWHDHSGNPARGTQLVGHHWALVGLFGVTELFKKWTPLSFPLLSRLIPGNIHPFGFVEGQEEGTEAMTFWDAVCPLVNQLSQMLGKLPLRVVADAYFSKAPFLNAMLSMLIQVITRMRKDAVGWDDPIEEPPTPGGKKKRGPKPTQPPKGKPWKIASLVHHFPLETVTVFIYGKLYTLQVVTPDLWIRDVTSQKVRVVVIKTSHDPVILLSTDLTLCCEEIIQIYALRFTLEISLRDAKQYFGLGDYQCTGFLAMHRFVGLSLMSYCLCRLAVLADVNASWLQGSEETSPLSFARVSRGVRRWVVRNIFQSSQHNGNFQNSEVTPEEIIRLIA